MKPEPKWPEVERYCLGEIETLHRRLEEQQPEALTNQLRGEIRAMRRVLKLGEEPAAPDPRKMVQPPAPDKFV